MSSVRRLPSCPVSYCNKEDQTPCSYKGQLPKAFSWDAISCNEALSQIDIKGVGRDIFWPPEVPTRNYTVESASLGLITWSLAAAQRTTLQQGLRGGPLISDPWSHGCRATTAAAILSLTTAILFGLMVLDPWSGQGVYPPGGGPEGPLVQRINNDGSQLL